MQHHQQQQDSNSYAQIVSNVNKDGNPYSANLPQLPANFALTENTESGKNSPATVKSEPEEKTDNGTEVEVVSKPLLSLVTAYGEY